MQAYETPLLRQHPRASLDTYINKIVGDEPHLARVRDISAGGMYLYKILEPHEMRAAKVGLEFKLPNSDEVIWAVGRVVREEGKTGEEGVGVQFERISRRHRTLIERYVQTRQIIG